MDYHDAPSPPPPNPPFSLPEEAEGSSLNYQEQNNPLQPQQQPQQPQPTQTQPQSPPLLPQQQPQRPQQKLQQLSLSVLPSRDANGQNRVPTVFTHLVHCVKHLHDRGNETHPFNTTCQHNLSTHSVNTPCQHTLSTHPITPI